MHFKSNGARNNRNLSLAAPNYMNSIPEATIIKSISDFFHLPRRQVTTLNVKSIPLMKTVFKTLD